MDGKNPDKPAEDRAWELLEKRPAPSLSPFFSRNVVREARLSSQKTRNALNWLKILFPVATAIVLLFLVELYEPSFVITDHGKTPVAASDNSADFEIIKNLDQLVTSEENTVWADTSRF